MIFLDMDGVLCDFFSAALRCHGREDLVAGWQPGLWSIEEALGITAAAFWAPIHQCGIGFWAELKPYPWAEQLVELCLSLDEVRIATTPSHSYFSAAGKHVWLEKHFRGRLDGPDRYMMGSNKHLLARPGAKLVDDNDRNCAKFREAGGEAVLVPQPWNAAHQNCDRLRWSAIVEGLTRSSAAA